MNTFLPEPSSVVASGCYRSYFGYYFMYADGLGLGLGLDTNSISGHNNRHTWSTYPYFCSPYTDSKNGRQPDRPGGPGSEFIENEASQ
jgi:hypothetical protein